MQNVNEKNEMNSYKINIYEKYSDLKNSGKNIQEFDNNDLWKIFEWLSCIKLTEEFKTRLYEYDDIDPEFKEQNKMSRNDTGIDASNLTDTIVQCKLRKDILNWKDCSTFFGSQNVFSEELNTTIIRWKKLIITRNKECKLSDNLKDRVKLFSDKTFARKEIIDYCENLISNPPKYPEIEDNKFKLRDYQNECINLIKDNKKNTIICIPTGTGKNVIIIYSMLDDKKYLILVPRIILMEQLKEEIVKHKPKLKNKIQLIGDQNNKFDENKNITICVFNSVGLIKEHCGTFEKIYIDEAHHINKPEIYASEENDEEFAKTDHAKDNPDNENISDSDELEDDPGDEEELEDDPEELKDDTEDELEDDPEDALDNSGDELEDDSEEELKDDTEDELKETTNYMKIIESLTQYNNNIYLSATIDEIRGLEYYKKDIRDMINQKYLCDYTIHVPIFNNDPTNKNVCEYLLKNYRNIIVYCDSQKEGTKINELFNILQPNSSKYIDCHTPKKERNDIIKKYKNGSIPFLVNVRILVEGFDAPITKGVCFIHLPMKKTTLIQIIGRALRLHPLKTIANIILPFSTQEDEKSINNFMKIMARNDSRIKKSFESKNLYGYISIEKTEENDDDENEEKNDIELRYEMIYNSLGVLMNREELFKNNLDKVKKYIDEHKKRPSSENKSSLEIRYLGEWISAHICYYKNKKYIMSNPEIYNLFNNFIEDPKYSKYLLNNVDKWKYRLEILKIYIEKNNDIPPFSIAVNKDTRALRKWFNSQKKYYKNKTHIMSNPEIYSLFNNFIEDPKYSKYLINNEQEWINRLEEIKQFTEQNNSLPSKRNKDPKIKSLADWLCTQKKNYKNKKQIMSNHKIYTLFTEFINDPKYQKYFLNNEQEWEYNLKSIKNYIEENNKRPSSTDKDTKVKSLGCWLKAQNTHYESKKYIMSNPKIYALFEEFVNDPKYKKYLFDNEQEWECNLKSVKNYIEENNKLPSPRDKDPRIKSLGCWVGTQKKKYKKKIYIMSDPKIYALWEQFINSDKYKQYFK